MLDKTLFPKWREKKEKDTKGTQEKNKASAILEEEEGLAARPRAGGLMAQQASAEV